MLKTKNLLVFFLLNWCAIACQSNQESVTSVQIVPTNPKIDNINTVPNPTASATLIPELKNTPADTPNTSTPTPSRTVHQTPIITPTLNNILCQESKMNLANRLNLGIVSNTERGTEIYSITGDGSVIVQITSDRLKKFSPIWSPNGKYLAYFIAYPNTPTEIWLMDWKNKSSEKLHVLNSSSFGELVWVPNSSKLILIENPSTIIVININDGNTKQYNLSQEGVFGIYQPTIIPNSSMIAFYGDLGRNFIPLHSFNWETGNLAQVIANYEGNRRDGFIFNAQWNPIYEDLLVVEEGLNEFSNLYLLNLANTEIKQLTTTESYKSQGVWSPNGEMIAYYTYGVDNSNIDVRIIDRNGQFIRKFIISANEGIRRMIWSPDNQHIAIVAHQGDFVLGDVYVGNVCSGLTEMIFAGAIDVSRNWYPSFD